MENMKTFYDILTQGNAAEAAGSPVAPNWPQMRGSLLLLGQNHSLETLCTNDVEQILPETFEDLPDAARDIYINKRIYQMMRREVLRLLALFGKVTCPWEALRMLIRRADRPDVENVFYHLRAHAVKAGLAPADLTTDWAIRLYETLGETGFKRASFRAGVTGLNKLFDIPDIAASGLLPASRLGPFPTYDKLGRRIPELPSWLNAALEEGRYRTDILSIWRAICISETVNNAACESPETLLQNWHWIDSLSSTSTDVAEPTMDVYKRRFKKVLIQACVPEHEIQSQSGEVA